ncbi:MAG: outer membrane lipid asymmetry maintenance protein MlaD [Pseudomonadota bacterium]|nr:outer membrane lipid asymmetry maintenance protein MlaD [Pseudomonadota bacterium]
MQKSINFVVGLFVVFAFVCLGLVAIRASMVEPIMNKNNYRLTARFDDVSGLNVHAPIRIAGVKIGVVESIELLPKTYQAKVILMIDDRFKNLPMDTSVSVSTEGLLGMKYLEVTPGFEDAFIKSGGEITQTVSSVSLEKLIGKLATSFVMEK